MKKSKSDLGTVMILCFFSQIEPYGPGRHRER